MTNYHNDQAIEFIESLEFLAEQDQDIDFSTLEMEAA